MTYKIIIIIIIKILNNYFLKLFIIIKNFRKLTKIIIIIKK